MRKICFGLCVAVFGFASSVSAQSRVDEHGVSHANEEALAANKRLGELLRKPTFITLRLVHNDVLGRPIDTPRSYRVGDWMDFQLLITQSLSEPMIIEQMLVPYDNTRVELFKDGDIVPYSKQAQENVDRSERSPSEGSAKPAQLQPGRQYKFMRIRLKDWYEPLGSGHYQVSVRRRFAWDGEWVQSSSVTFDVQPETSPSLK